MSSLIRPAIDSQLLDLILFKLSHDSLVVELQESDKREMKSIKEKAAA
jgi:hypothetical protein